jgi:transposase
MNVASRYWNICRVNSASEKRGYEFRVVPIAQGTLKQILETSDGHHDTLQSALLAQFRTEGSSLNPIDRAQAGLCLRCYVSEPILRACQRIDRLFRSSQSFTYRDLLPFVLNDDGETLVILDNDHKTQLILGHDQQPQPTNYKFFTVEVLRLFRTNSQPSMSLDNWTYLQTKQQPELKAFLSEFGFQHLSDWACLNRARPKQLQCLTEHDQRLVESFHAVYRRDRRMQQSQVGRKKCPEPSPAQLQEMQTWLQQQNITIATPTELLKNLKQIAQYLRQLDVWSSREALEIEVSEDGYSIDRPDLIQASINESDLEQQELLEFFHQQLTQSLTRAIEQEIQKAITRLQQSKRYQPFASQLIPGLKLYYEQGVSLKEIAPVLGMTSKDQAGRILNLGELLNHIRINTVQQLLDRVLEKAQEKGLTQLPPHPDYLKAILEQVEAFADAEVFRAATEELRAGKNRSMDSPYAQQLCRYLNHLHHSS